MKEILLDHITTAIQVAIGTFLATAATMFLVDHTIVWSSSFLLSVVSTAGTAALKEVAAKFFTVKLGGRKLGSKTLFGARKR